MTQKDIALIERINQSGIDNTRWGVVRHDGHLTSELHGTDQGFIVPAHIYIYRDEKSEAAIGDTVAPDATIYRPDGEIIDLYFLHG